MGLFDKIFTKPQAVPAASAYFQTLTAYKPVFTSYEGSLYEMERVRAAIHTHATFSAKLKPEVKGSAYAELARILQYAPNRYSDTYKFLYRIRTILEMENTAFIVPILNDSGNITGYYPISPRKCELLEYKGAVFVRYTFSNGQAAAIEFEKVGILNKFQYKNDFFGENNNAMYATATLLKTQQQSIEEGAKSAATVRFMGRLNNTYKPDTIEEERGRFRDSNLGARNSGGIVLVDNKYADLKQIISKPYTIDAAQMGIINNNVYNYFNINEKIIQNAFSEDEWNAYYEGAIEPFALQLSLVLTNMTYTRQEIARGNEIMLTANRLQYASNGTKLSIITQLFDRGFLTHNEGREILNLAPIEGGDKYYIRKEYAEKDNLNDEENEGGAV